MVLAWITQRMIVNIKICISPKVLINYYEDFSMLLCHVKFLWWPEWYYEWYCEYYSIDISVYWFVLFISKYRIWSFLKIADLNLKTCLPIYKYLKQTISQSPKINWTRNVLHRPKNDETCKKNNIHNAFSKITQFAKSMFKHHLLLNMTLNYTNNYN